MRGAHAALAFGVLLLWANCDALAAEQIMASRGPSPQIFSPTYFQQRGYPSAGLWTPQTEEVENARSSLGSYVSSLSSSPSAALVLKDIDAYKYQFAGITHEGTQIIVVNAFCEAFWNNSDIWRQNFVEVNDGGHCFFRAYFDREKGAFVHLEVNGEA